MRPTRATPGCLHVLGFLTGVAATLAFGIGLQARAGGPHVSVLVITAIVALAFVRVFVEPLARRLAPSLGVAAVRLGLASLAPLFVLFALGALGKPLAVAEWICGTPELEAIFAGTACLFALGWLGTWFAAMGLEALGPTSARVRLRKHARFGIAITSALLLLSVLRLSTRPPIDFYLESLPLVATLPERRAIEAPRPEGPAADPYEIPVVQSVAVGGMRIHRACIRGHCRLDLERGTAERTHVPWSAGGFVGVDAQQPVFVHRDVRHHLLVTRCGRNTRAFRDDEHRITATGGSERDFLSPTDLHVSDVADSASPPAAWILGALVSVIAAAVVFRRRSAKTSSGDEAANGSEAERDAEAYAWIVAVTALGASPVIAAALGRLVVG